MYQLTPEKIEALKNDILQQAKLYLEDADEFYPFGSVLDKDEKIKPISVYWGEEFPNSTDVLNKLDEVIKKGIQLEDYKAAAIGVDVYLKTNTISGVVKREALEVRLYVENSLHINHFYYYKENNQYFFEPVTPLMQ